MKITDRFRPKADIDQLQQWNREAWQAVHNSITSRIKGWVGEALAVHIESQYPAADLAVLTRYGCTRTIEDASVSVRLPGSNLWNEHMHLALPRKVTVATTYQGLYCGGPRWWEEPESGLTPEFAAKVKAGLDDLFPTWESYLAYAKEHGQRQVPAAVEPPIIELVASYKQYQAQYNQISDWPRQFKQERGDYPTWAEIADQFPVAGRLIREHLDPAPAAILPTADAVAAAVDEAQPLLAGLFDEKDYPAPHSMAA